MLFDEKSSNKLLRDSAYYNFGNAFYLGSLWIINVALVRLGGFEDAGLFSLAMSCCSVFGMLANYGLRSFQVSDITTQYSDNAYLCTRLLTSFLQVCGKKTAICVWWEFHFR